MPQDTTEKAFIIAGSDGGQPSGELFKNLWHEFEQNPTAGLTDKLNTMLAAGAVGKVVTQLGWQVMTGGYYEGKMGRASLSAHHAANKNLGPQPIAAVFSDFWPDDNLEAHGEKITISGMDERTGFFLKNAGAFFLIEFTGLGSLDEITAVLKNEQFTDQATSSKKPLKPKPIIIVDPTGNTVQEILELIKKFSPNSLTTDEQNFTDRIFIIGGDYFQAMIGKYSQLKSLSQKGEKAIKSILENQPNPNLLTLKKLAKLI